MEGRMFLLDRGCHVAIRNLEGTMVSFESKEDFDRYYSGKLDLSDEYYVDYEPERKLLYKSAKGSFEPLSNQWNGELPEYEAVIEDVQNMRDKLDDPYFGMDLEEARQYKLQHLKRLTFSVITQFMPGWRQIKWKEYLSLYKKVDAGVPLSDLEQRSYDRFPDDTETHADCYKKCETGINWIMECLARHDNKEQTVKKARGIKAVKAVADPDYPQWELENG